jgi:hypothetical protein
VDITGSECVIAFLGHSCCRGCLPFRQQKLYNGQLFFDGGDTLAKLKAALNEQFGQPDFTNESMQLFKWKWADSGFEVALYHQSKFQRTTLSFTKK